MSNCLFLCLKSGVWTKNELRIVGDVFRSIPWDDRQEFCVLGEDHAQSVLEGADCVHYETPHQFGSLLEG